MLSILLVSVTCGEDLDMVTGGMTISVSVETGVVYVVYMGRCRDWCSICSVHGQV